MTESNKPEPLLGGFVMNFDALEEKPDGTEMTGHSNNNDGGNNSSNPNSNDTISRSVPEKSKNYSNSKNTSGSAKKDNNPNPYSNNVNYNTKPNLQQPASNGNDERIPSNKQQAKKSNLLRSWSSDRNKNIKSTAQQQTYINSREQESQTYEDEEDRNKERNDECHEEPKTFVENGNIKFIDRDDILVYIDKHCDNDTDVEEKFTILTTTVSEWDVLKKVFKGQGVSPGSSRDAKNHKSTTYDDENVGTDHCDKESYSVSRGSSMDRKSKKFEDENVGTDDCEQEIDSDLRCSKDRKSNNFKDENVGTDDCDQETNTNAGGSKDRRSKKFEDENVGTDTNDCDKDNIDYNNKYTTTSCECKPRENKQLRSDIKEPIYCEKDSFILKITPVRYEIISAGEGGQWKSSKHSKQAFRNGRASAGSQINDTPLGKGSNRYPMKLSSVNLKSITNNYEDGRPGITMNIISFKSPFT